MILAAILICLILTLVILSDWYLNRPQDLHKQAILQYKKERKRQEKIHKKIQRLVMNPRLDILKQSNNTIQGVVIGVGDKGTYPYIDGKRQIYIPTQDLNRHTVVFGMSGTGKTETLKRLAFCEVTP